MFKKALAFFIIVLIIGTDLKAQQEQTFSQYMFVPTLYNSGHTGVNNAICVTGIMKQQWVGLEGAPTVYSFSVESPVKILRGGLGLVITTDQIAGYNNTAVKLKYAYHRKIGSDVLGIGIGLGLVNQRLDFSYFNVTGDDPLLTSTEEESGMIFDIDAGLYYQRGNKWYAGVSSTQINQGKMDLSDGQTQLKRAYYATGGYYFRFLRMPKIVISPSFFMGYTANAPIQINVGAIGEYNNMFWGGVLYKHQEGIAVMAGIEYKNIKVGYAYDINTNQLKNGGSHEIRLGYCFKLEIEKPKRSYKNTRYL
jgi:type IX secretion system PorP/SprF family membrane protein